MNPKNHCCWALIQELEEKAAHPHETREVRVWFLDSGCSNHMCGIREWFTDFDDKFRITVRLGDNSKLLVEGKGSITLEIDGIVQTITEVCCIPNLKNNLISLGQLQEKGLSVVLENNTCMVYHPVKGLIIQSNMSTNRMFMIKPIVMYQKCLKVTETEDAMLWHSRYGHLGFKGLKLLAQKGMVRGLPELNENTGVCENCQLGKQHRESFPKASTRKAKEKLQLVHADVCGPIQPESNGGKRYFLTFIHEYSRHTWIYLLSQKLEAFDMFKKFKARVEKESGCFIKGLRTDRGCEFNSRDFNEFCSRNGIMRQLTAAYTPEHG